MVGLDGWLQAPILFIIIIVSFFGWYIQDADGVHEREECQDVIH